MVNLSVVANLRATLAALRGIIVLSSVSEVSVGQFALPIGTPNGTAFNRGSFGSLHPGAAQQIALGT